MVESRLSSPLTCTNLLNAVYGTDPTATNEEPDMPNIELLNKALHFIEENPDEWKQDRWATVTDCGTSYCFAGWALTLACVPVIVDDYDALVNIDTLNGVLAKWGTSIDPDDYETDGFLGVRDAAEALLDIDDMHLRDLEDGELYSAADVLFEADNGLDRLRKYVSALCSETVGAGAR